MEGDQQVTKRIFRNASSQMVGRLMITLCRFVIAMIIVRNLGVETYGKYALVLSLLLVGDCLVDFGMTDFTVRMLCREPEKWYGFLRSFCQAKGILTVVASLILLFWMIANSYDKDILLAGLIGLIELALFGVILFYRTVFKSLLLMEREVVSELVSVCVFLPLFYYGGKAGWGVTGLIGCYVGARAFFMGLMVTTGRVELWRLKAPATAQVTTPESTSRAILKASPLGFSSLLVILYMALDPILLASLVDLESVGLFAGSERFLNLMILAIYPVADSLFPVLSGYFGKDPQRFQKRMNEAVRVIVILAGGGFCVFYCGAGFFLGLMGPEMLAGTTLFQAMSATFFLKALASIMGPVIISSGGIRISLWLTLFSVIIKICLVFVFVPRMGILGIPVVNALTEVLNLVFTNIVVRISVKVFINWTPLFVCLPILALVVVFIKQIDLMHSLTGLILAGLIYLTLATITGLVPWRDLLRYFNRPKVS